MMTTACYLKKCCFVSLLMCLLFVPGYMTAQMRQVYLDTNENNEIRKISFYTPAEGFVAFTNYIGFSKDSGRTFEKKYITTANVNYNNNNVNLTFGFYIQGVKALNARELFVYGDYGLVPAILYSTDAGNTFKLIFHSQLRNFDLLNGTGITDFALTPGGNTVYAIDADRIMRSTNKGSSWSVSSQQYNSYFKRILVIDDNTAFIYNNDTKLLKTSNGGNTWQQLNLPAGSMLSASFLNADKGWVAMRTADQEGIIYATDNGGITWTRKNDPQAASYYFSQIQFVNATTGYGLGGLFTLFSTKDAGRSWQQLPRDNDYTYLGYSHNDFQLFGNNQLWAGGGHGFLELSNNGGGSPIPAARFKIDTIGVAQTKVVKLVNFSGASYSFQWFKNDTLLSTAYDASYSRDVFKLNDTIRLIVSDGQHSDTTTRDISFNPPVIIYSLSGNTGTLGTEIIIKGLNFKDVTAVSFGGQPAKSFSVQSSTKISAVVGKGASGDVVVTTAKGTASYAGFRFISLPAVNLPVSLSKNILCKSEQINVTLQNTEANTRYDLVDSKNNVVGSGLSTGGQLVFQTSLISQSDAYRIIASSNDYPDARQSFSTTIPLTVEKTTAAFVTDRVNITAGETIRFISRSKETQDVIWNFNGDASITTAAADKPAVSYGTPGMKTLQLISTSKNGCRDTLNGNAIFVYDKSEILDVCYASQLHLNSQGHPLTSMTLCPDDGFLVSATSSDTPVVVSRYGSPGKLPAKTTSYLAKYTTDGTLSWMNYFVGQGSIVQSTLDKDGNIYIIGNTRTNSYLHLNTGDSISFSCIPGDTTRLDSRSVGFTMKLDPSGKYLWHTILYDPTQLYIGYSNIGANVTHITVKEDNIILSGDFPAKVSYFRNGQMKVMYDFPSSTGDARNQRVVILKMKPDGELLWNSYLQNHSVNYYRLTGIGIDQRGNSYYSGILEGAMEVFDAESGSGAQKIGIKDHVGFPKGYLLKFDVNGKFQWIDHFLNESTGGRIDMNAIATDDAGNSYITGNGDRYYKPYLIKAVQNNKDTTIVSDSLAAFVLCKFDTNGKFSWSAGSKYNNTNYGRGMQLYLNGSSIYAVGTIQTSTRNPTVTITSTDYNHRAFDINDANFFVAQYDLNGVLQRMVSSGKNTGGGVEPEHIGMDSKGNFLMAANTDIWNGGGRTAEVFNNIVNTTGGCFIKTNLNFCQAGTPPLANAGANKTICAGDSVMIGSTAVAGNNYYWASSPIGFIAKSAGMKVSPKETTSYYLTVTNADGLTARDSVVVTVKGDKGAAGPNRSICETTVTTIGLPARPGRVYSWTADKSAFSATIANPEVSPATTTSYFLTVKDTAGCLTTTTDTVLVTVIPKVVPVVSVDYPDTAVCEEASITFKASSVNGGTAPFYSWLIDGRLMNPGWDTRTLSSVTTPYKVQAIVKSNALCAIPASDTSKVIQITVRKKIIPTLTIAASDTAICKGKKVTFTANASELGDNPSYKWVKNDWYWFSAPDNKVYIDNDLNDNDVIKLVLTTNTGCGPVSVTSNPITVRVSTPAPQVTIKADPKVICSGTPVTFTASYTGMDTEPTSIQWKKNGRIVNGKGAVYVDSMLNNNDAVAVLLTWNLPCGSTQKASEPYYIQLNRYNPALSISTARTALCAGETAVFQAVATDAGTINAITWKKNGQLTGSTGTTYNDNALRTGDVIQAVMQSTSSCGTTSSVLSNQISVTVSEVPAPTVVISGQTSVVAGTPVTITAVIGNTSGVTTWQWQDSTDVAGWKVIPGQGAPALVYTPQRTGVKVRGRLRSTLDCGMVTEVTSNTLTFTLPGEQAADVQVRTYPNPIADVLTVELNPADQWTTLGIYDLSGFQRYIIPVANKSKVTQQVSSLSPGIYFIILKNDQGTSQRIKVVKQ
ncbi:YCF48-related protein [Chitinophaga flava]|uniref:Ig-like domain-containing protein n=1 Tax=Chitinophaga flava TaxID=2259036 RepID=A0A365XT09_9BACT|nr:T9SS type A sorting domain-containing protein [Chitinophaga flava]RBL89270.1 hypothetical protein DF182_22365 [Chitinophaga flava]